MTRRRTAGGALRAGTLLGCFVVSLGGATPADSLTINLTFDSGTSDSPGFDSTGALLQPIMQAAADYWEDIIEDAGTLNITYYYNNLNDTNGTLGLHTNLATSGGKPTSARIQFDTTLNGTERVWYFDPTPTNHSEFDLQQTLYRDLNATNQSGGTNAWFNGAPPDLLEVGYRGATAAGAPANAVNGFDIFSTAIHEIGHAVGLTGNVTSPETNDGDYDVNTAFVNGAVMAIGDNNNHISPGVALMCAGCGATNLRRMPTATDVFAAAAAANWTTIDLPRADFLGGTNWGTAGNWEGGQVPGSADWAYVRNGGNIQLNVNDTVARLFVGEGTDLFTNANRLDVNGTVTIEHDGVAVRPQIFVETGGELEANRLDLNGGELDMTGGLADINGILDINETNGFTGRITGNGTVDVSVRLDNDGLISPDGGTLNFTSAAANPWNLDGGSNGIVNATSGDINFNSGGQADTFDGTMTVGAGRSITFVEGWDLGSAGDLNLNGGASVVDRAEIDGGAMGIFGNVTVNGFGELDGVTTFNSASNVVIGAGDRLDIGNSTADTITYIGGSFTGNGTLVQDGDATVTAGNTVDIDVANFDFDGDSISDTTILAGATMNITGSSITDAHDGVVTINSGTLNVATGNTVDFGGFPLFVPAPWTMDGSLIFLDNGQNPVLSGSKVNITGAVSVPITGTGQITAPVEFHPTSNTEITSATDRLQLNGTTTFNGGTFVGFGELEQNANAIVISDTTLNIGRYDWDGGGAVITTINDGVAFTINASTIDDFGAFDGTVNVNGGTLAVNTTAAWGMAGTMNLANGGGAIPTVSGQQMNVSDTINATGGESHINAPVNFLSTTVVTVETGSELELNGTTTYNGGSYTGLGRLKQDGSSIINAATTIDVSEYDMDGDGSTSTTLNADLTINSTNIDIGNNIFNGTLRINDAFSQLTMNTASIWTMAGVININHPVNSANTSIAGQDFIMSGTTNINAWTGWSARATVTGTVNVNLAGDVFSMNGGNAVDTNIIDGGLITGPGRLSIGTSKRLVGNGTISTALLSLNLGGRLYADDGTLTVSSSLVSSTFSRIGTNDTDGILNITNAWNTNVYQALELNGGSVIGALITNDGLTTGFGRVAPGGGFRNNNVLTANGGTLDLDPSGALDLDGIGGNGTINALAGSVVVSKNIGLPSFDGTLNVGTGQSFEMDFGGLSNTGQVNLTGGTYIAPQFLQFGDLDVSAAPSSVKTFMFFENGSNNTLNADLTLLLDSLVRPGASINGSASLIIAGGGTMTALDGAQIGVKLENRGKVFIGSSPGAVVASDYTQTLSGELDIELGGLTQGVTFDWLKVADNASLAGMLDVSLIGGHVPTLGDTYEVITAGSGIAGVFNTIDFPAIPNIGLRVNYTPNTVELIAGLLGDLDGDGFVGINDLNIVLASWNTFVTPGVWLLGDPSGDGFIGITDLNVVLGNWNAGTPPLVEAINAIPEPGVLGMMAMGVFGLVRRRRCR